MQYNFTNIYRDVKNKNNMDVSLLNLNDYYKIW